MDYFTTFIFLFIFVIFQCDKTEERIDKSCEQSYYFSSKTADCIPCEVKCSLKEGITENCGHNDNGEKIEKACRICQMGIEYSILKYYPLKNRKVRVCESCTDCKLHHRTYKRNCTSNADAICGECLPGYYRGDKTECFKCSPCCSKNKRWNDRKEECINSGVNPKCSCSRSTKLNCRGENMVSCNKPKATTFQQTLQSVTTTAKTSTKTTSKILSSSNIKTEYKKLNTIDDNIETSPTRTAMVSTGQNVKLSTTKTQTTIPKSINEGKNRSNQRRPNLTAYKVESILPSVKSQVTRKNIDLVSKKMHSRPTALAAKMVGSNAITKENWKMRVRLIALCSVASLAILGICVACIICSKQRKKGTSTPSLTEIHAKSSEKTSEKSISTITSVTDDETKPCGIKGCKQEEEEEEEESYFADIIVESIPKELVNKAEVFDPDKKQRNKDIGIEKDHGKFLKSDSMVPVPFNEEENKKTRKNEYFQERIPLMSLPESSMLQQKSSECRKSQQITRKNYLEERTCINCTYSRYKQCPKMIEDLKTCQKKELQKYLDVEHLANTNWKEVAVYFKVDEKDIQIWETMLRAGGSPTNELLFYLNTQRCKIEEIVKCFDKIGRFDVKIQFLHHLKNGCLVCNRDYGQENH